MSTRVSLVVTACVLALSAPMPADASLTIRLSDAFINKYANRATIATQVTVDAAAPRPHSGSQDGDIHAAGTSDDIGLATVVEIMNASDPGESDATRDLESATGKSVALEGYWRLWPEHGGQDNDFTQFGSVPPITDTNPPHVFEIHPILSIDGIALGDSQHKINRYSPKDATTAFTAYEQESCQIADDGKTTTIATNMIGYNYVRFEISPLERTDAHKLDDAGYSFFAKVFDPETQEMLVSKVRMIYADDTMISDRIKSLAAGDTLTVWGIPRIDLSLVRYRAGNSAAASRSLPYEMVIVAAP